MSKFEINALMLLMFCVGGLIGMLIGLLATSSVIHEVVEVLYES